MWKIHENTIPQWNDLFFTIMEEDTPYKRGVNYVKLSKKYVSLLILLFLTPIVFLFLGYVVSNSPNERPQLIERFECIFELILGIMSELRCGSVSDTISLLENSLLILQSWFASIWWMETCFPSVMPAVDKETPETVVSTLPLPFFPQPLTLCQMLCLSLSPMEWIWPILKILLLLWTRRWWEKPHFIVHQRPIVIKYVRNGLDTGFLLWKCATLPFISPPSVIDCRNPVKTSR